MRSLVGADPDGTLARVDEPSPRLDASRPSRLRAVGFLLTVLGALLIGAGAVGVWVTIGIPNESSHTPIRGSDLADGRVSLVCALLLLVGVIASRMVRSRRSRWLLAALVFVSGIVAAGVATAFLRGVDERSAVVQALGIPREFWTRFGVFRDFGPGVFLVLGGGLFAVIGAVLTLMWAGRAAENAPPA
jgi:hypothetical protein